MYNVTETDFLAHHGIVGMHWGERNGPPYPLDREVSRKIKAEGKAEAKAKKQEIKKLENSPYSEGNYYKLAWAKEDLSKIKSKTKLQLHGEPTKAQLKYEKEYLAKGYSKEDAAIAAFNKDRTRKALMIVGGVTLAAVVGYSLYKHGQFSTDSVIKSGQVMRRVSMDRSTQLHDAFYATPNKLDNLKYRGAYGGGQLGGAVANIPIYNKTLEAVQDIRIAGGKSGRQIVGKALGSDKDLAKAYAALVRSTGLADGIPGGSKIVGNIRNGKIGRKEYDAINRALVVHDHHIQGADALHKKLYDAFRKAGYDAVKDVNDMKYSGYRAKLPVIVFNGNAATVKSVERLSRSSMQADKRKAYAAMFAPATVSTIGKYAALGVTAKALTTMWNEKSKDQIVSQYKKEHPNTKMSYNEIYRSEAERLGLDV